MRPGRHLTPRLLSVTALFVGIGWPAVTAERAQAMCVSELPQSVWPSVVRDSDAIAAGPDGNVWFTEDGTGRGPQAIVRVTPAGRMTEFQAGISAGAGPTGIAAGPDGNLWFTEPYGDRIGRITPSGQVTEFSQGITPVADPGGVGPVWITGGPDGNVWFTEPDASRIGRITPSGQVSEFSQGISAGGDPYAITVGPDGNLWFTEPGLNQIGRITPSGQVTEFKQGIPEGPDAIAAGPDGNLWFTSAGGIGVITPGGDATAFSNGIDPDAGVSGIAVGPDGNLWFTENEAAAALGRITLSGQVTSVTQGFVQEPFAIAAGPARTLWFTEENTVARIAPSGSCPRVSIASTSVTVSGEGSAAVTLRCGKGSVSCAGTLNLAAGARGRAIASAIYTIPAGHAGKVVLRVSARGLALLRNARSRELSVTATAAGARRVLTLVSSGGGRS